MTGEQASPAPGAGAAVPGRSCGTCSLCCKVYVVAALDKPAGQWCGHCQPGRGCTIYETRPDQCRAFECLWRTAAWLGAEWKPDRARFVLTQDRQTGALLVQVDLAQAGAWRKEPYHGQLRRWAAAGRAAGRRVIVFVGREATLVLPRPRPAARPDRARRPLRDPRTAEPARHALQPRHPGGLTPALHSRGGDCISAPRSPDTPGGRSAPAAVRGRARRRHSSLKGPCLWQPPRP